MISYEERIDSLNENTQMDFLQYSIDTIGLQEGPDIKGALKKVWEKIKSAWEWIKKKVSDAIKWIKSKFKSKDKEAEDMAKDAIAKSKSTDADKNATAALAVISKSSDKKSEGETSAKIIATTNGITYKIINKPALENIMALCDGSTEEAAEMSSMFRDKFMTSAALSNIAGTDSSEISKLANSAKDKAKQLENNKNNLIKSISAKYVSAGVVKSIYQSYKECKVHADMWEEDGNKFNTIMNQAISDCTKFTSTIESHASSSDSNDNERKVLAKAHTLISAYNVGIQAVYKVVNDTFRTIISLKNELFMSLHMLYTAYNRYHKGSSGSYNGGNSTTGIGQNSFSGIGQSQTGLATRSRGDVATI